MNLPNINIPECNPQPEGDYTLIAGELSNLCVGWQVQWTVSAQFAGADPFPLGAESEVLYSSSDETIAVIDQSGLITGTGPGTVVFTASYAGQSVTAELTVEECPTGFTVELDGTCSPCADSEFEADLVITGGTAPYTVVIIDGVLPEGVTLDDLTFSGIPTVPGNYPMALRLTDASGFSIELTLTLAVIGITTTSITEFTVGQPYSFQLEAAGGSGNYGWTYTGTLPDGLTMSDTGLITGTPLAGGDRELRFSVSDLECGPYVPTLGQPWVSGFSAESQTTIATILGYAGYGAEPGPPKRYKKLTVTGQSEQWVRAVIPEYTPGHWLEPWEGIGLMEPGWDALNGPIVAHARYVYSGAGEIDQTGAQISDYRKDYYAPCSGGNEPVVYGRIASAPGTYRFVPNVAGASGWPIVIRGYCYAADPASCHPCADPIVLIGDTAQNTIFDFPDFLEGTVFDPVSHFLPTELRNKSANGIAITVRSEEEGAANVVLPKTTYGGVLRPWLLMFVENDYTFTLSDEYTDAEALANALVYSSNAKFAENLPRTTGLVSRWTTSTFSVECSNLEIGMRYSLEVTFKDSDGTLTPQEYEFTASASTETISDAIPTPAEGHTVRVTNPKVHVAT